MSQNDEHHYPLWNRCNTKASNVTQRARILRADAPVYTTIEGSLSDVSTAAGVDMESIVDRYYGVHSKPNNGNVNTNGNGNGSQQGPFSSPSTATAPLTPNSGNNHSTLTSPFTIQDFQDFGEAEFNQGFSPASAVTQRQQVYASKQGGRGRQEHQHQPSYHSAPLPFSPNGAGGSGCNPSSRYHQTQQQGPIESADGMLYHVQFKRSHRYYGLHGESWGLAAAGALGRGAVVVVEADRGVDIGVLRGFMPASGHREDRHTAGHRGRGFAVGDPTDGKRLLRLATEEEQGSIFTKVAEEETTLQTARIRAAQRQLPMRIIDAEFQLDRHKLTFFFEADRRVDFRELVSELFSQYKTRIWMAQVDSGTGAALRARAVQEATEPERDPAMVVCSADDTDDDGRWLARFVGLLPSPAERSELERQCTTNVGDLPDPNISIDRELGNYASSSGLHNRSLFTTTELFSDNLSYIHPAPLGSLQAALLHSGGVTGPLPISGSVPTPVPTHGLAQAQDKAPPGLDGGFYSYTCATPSTPISQTGSTDCGIDIPSGYSVAAHCADLAMSDEQSPP